jgi:diamine N-acetyltransferase
MIRLTGKDIYLRALEPEDIDFLYQVENDTELWPVSNTLVPYSRYVLSSYLNNAHKDIYEVKQLRLAICNTADNHLIGLIDLYDFEPQHGRAGVGVVISDKQYRKKGHAAEALAILKDYAFRQLDLHQLYAGITRDNQASIHLFERAGFVKTGLKQDWVRRGQEYVDEFIYQCIRE